MTMTVAGKSFYVLSDEQGRSRKIVRREKIVTTTGTSSAHPQNKRQHLYLTLASS